MPDPGVHAFVTDMLKQGFGVDLTGFPDHWVPLGIMGTLDWVTLAGWWILRYTGMFDSQDQYNWFYEYDMCELSPDHLTVYRDDAERNCFNNRLENPGLTEMERGEAVQFLIQNFYEKFEKDKSREQSKYFVPPQDAVEVILWSTLMWILSKHGRDWLYGIDQVISSTHDFGVAYWYKANESLLDPQRMICTERSRGTCRQCKSELWCVAGAYLDGAWYHVCNNCLMELHLERPDATDGYSEERLTHPKCPHLSGIGEGGCAGSCHSECQHSGMNDDVFWKMAEAVGTSRVEKYSEAVRVAGKNPRQLAGQTGDDIVNYFK